MGEACPTLGPGGSGGMPPEKIFDFETDFGAIWGHFHCNAVEMDSIGPRWRLPDIVYGNSTEDVMQLQRVYSTTRGLYCGMGRKGGGTPAFVPPPPSSVISFCMKYEFLMRCLCCC